MKKTNHVLTQCLVLALAIATAAPLAAQKFELVIRNNAVFINGKEVPEENLSGRLDLTGLDVKYSGITSSPDERPVVRINGVLFVIEPDRLALASRPISIVTPEPGGGALISFERAVELGHDLQRTTKGLRLSLREVPTIQKEVVETLQQAQTQMEEAAAALQSLPKMEIMRYFNGVLREDFDLYERLVEEVEMERQAAHLADEVRRMSRGKERNQKLEALRERLSAIFERKQHNRRREIQQLEDKLQSLQERLKEREDVRRAIIERRLQELLGTRF